MTASGNADQHAAWNGDSGHRWAENPDQRDNILAPVADALLAAAGIAQGETVLDIGCGCGATALGAARAAGPFGSVFGIDLSGPMLAVARRRAREHAVPNVRFVQDDAQVYALEHAAFDVAISRFGTMFFADPVAAFANIAGALRPGGRVCLATWQRLAANDWLTVPGAVLLRYAAPPEPPGGPGMFAQSDPAGIGATLSAAGFAVVGSRPVTFTMAVGASPAEAAEYLLASGPSRALLDTIPGDVRPAAIDEVQSALAGHAAPGGVQLDAAIWLTTARRPG